MLGRVGENDVNISHSAHSLLMLFTIPPLVLQANRTTTGVSAMHDFFYSDDSGTEVPLSIDNQEIYPDVHPSIASDKDVSPFDPFDPLADQPMSSRSGEWDNYDNPTDPPWSREVPAGFEAYDDMGRFMRGSDGNLYMTPGYRDYINSIEIDWTGVAADLAWIITGALTGGAVGPIVAGLAGAIFAGWETWNQLESQP